MAPSSFGGVLLAMINRREPRGQIARGRSLGRLTARCRPRRVRSARAPPMTCLEFQDSGYDSAHECRNKGGKDAYGDRHDRGRHAACENARHDADRQREGADHPGARLDRPHRLLVP
jgi:hypothetical protein